MATQFTKWSHRSLFVSLVFYIILNFPIANVQCQYDSPSDTEAESERHPSLSSLSRPPEDHTYDLRDEPPAYIIHHVKSQPATVQVTAQMPLMEMTPKIMTLGPGYGPGVNVIHVGDSRPQVNQTSAPAPATASAEYSINKRIRRSEALLRQAAECVRGGLTFQTVSEKFNIPISTIRFFMARKGLLPKRRRGRTSQLIQPCHSPEPPFHMQHFKLPDMIAFSDNDSETSASKATSSASS